MHSIRCSKRYLIFSLLSLVALLGMLALGMSLLQHPGQAHAAGVGVASDGQPFPLIGPKQHYLALGDSLAFGYQPCLLTNPPTCSTTDGYVNDLFTTLQNEGTKDVTNLGCPSESSITFITGGICSYPHPFPSQLQAALAYLKANAGKVSPVTLDIGVNDVKPDLTITPTGCTVGPNFKSDLATLNNNLNDIILPQLQAALTVTGRVTGSIVMMNYYNPFPNCLTNPDFATDFTQFDTDLATDVNGFGSIVDVFGAFGGITTPNLCTDTWMCGNPPSPTGPDIHPRDPGYMLIADTFAAALPAN
jgi:lysophospholipase L1-like esterase